MEKKQTYGRDVSAPLETLTINGKEYKLRFDNETFRIAEDVYEDHYKRQKNFAEITMELSRTKIGAIMAVLYGAILSATPDLTLPWADFTRDFRITSIPGVTEALMAGVTAALPDAEDTPENP